MSIERRKCRRGRRRLRIRRRHKRGDRRVEWVAVGWQLCWGGLVGSPADGIALPQYEMWYLCFYLSRSAQLAVCWSVARPRSFVVCDVTFPCRFVVHLGLPTLCFEDQKNARPGPEPEQNRSEEGELARKWFLTVHMSIQHWWITPRDRPLFARHGQLTHLLPWLRPPKKPYD